MYRKMLAWGAVLVTVTLSTVLASAQESSATTLEHNSSAVDTDDAFLETRMTMGYMVRVTGGSVFTMDYAIREFEGDLSAEWYNSPPLAGEDEPWFGIMARIPSASAPGPVTFGDRCFIGDDTDNSVHLGSCESPAVVTFETVWVPFPQVGGYSYSLQLIGTFPGGTRGALSPQGDGRLVLDETMPEEFLSGKEMTIGDGAGEQLTMTSHEGGEVFTDGESISGTALPGARISITSGPATVGSCAADKTMRWECTVTVHHDGPVTLTINSGNYSAPLQLDLIVVDSAPPTPLIDLGGLLALITRS
ncbi:hypothetical protein [Microbacterium oxydans]|uniref:hypothetical protein n=1 Tax=Microbacterium oxydans TaxID=82380 RepID=UPI00226B5F2E|nr:hypothetical protein [Microbacterium oxydans]WAA65604.1 hypothetical protein MME74_15420 [Microbacterium oxydans]